ncbi:uncharacterized protein LOC117469628 isoform X3 [Trematomus bernacchii]|uniref:uncharacterized protein LOC117469628 isoform X2 n=1 Tax=Trematomus bernacchii TaxID=40690 RepID=UPI00146BCF26|nr:uncharacterized protein LOC117469628 isoform X2 [Trematomus bernacchii]XP_033969990.1 uncharacterized protein LOC117469628 isoform X3 [Trematomus bernacchii]
MDLKALETKWRTALSSILDQLTADEFRKLLFNLEKIPQGLKEGRVRGDMPSVIIQHYSTEGSITLMDRLMKDLPRLDAAVQQPLRGMKDELKKLRQKKKAATSKPADSGAVPKKKEPAAEVSGGSETQSLDDSIEKLILAVKLLAPQEKSIFDLKSSGILETEAIVGKVVKKSELVYPESPLTSVKDIKSSPLKTYVSVEGTVTQIDPIKKVKVQHEEKKTKRFKLKQEAEEISVTLWDEAIKQSKDLSVGDVLLLNNMKRKVYLREVYLNSTQFTKITKAKTLDFQLKKGFGADLPLSVEAEIQGNRIIKMTDPENI